MTVFPKVLREKIDNLKDYKHIFLNGNLGKFRRFRKSNFKN